MNKILQEDIESIVSEALPWEKFKGATVLVTGANGLLPSYMTEILLKLNEKDKLNIKVIAVIRDIEKAKKRYHAHLDHKSLKIIQGDLSEPFSISDSIDYIIHGASHASPKLYGADPVGTLAPNILGTDQLLRLGKKNNIRGFLYFSSSEVYGQVSENQIPTKEGDFGFLDPNQLRSCYAESKRAGETLCRAWNHQYGVPTYIVRPFHTYGPTMGLADGRVFSDFVGNVVSKENITLKSDGSATRAYCYVADATRGFFMVLLKGRSGEAYNVGHSGAEVSVLDLANTLVKLFPERKLKVIRENLKEPNSYLKSPVQRSCPDTSKMRSLGWAPKFSIEEGFQRTILSFI